MENNNNNNALGMLLPENKLHICRREQVRELAKEFFSCEQEKPLVIFYHHPTNYDLTDHDGVMSQAETILERDR